MRTFVRMLVMCVLVSVGSAHAQTAAGDTAAAQLGSRQQRRDKIKQRIRALRAYTLTEQLELDEATAAKLFPALAKYDDEFDKLLQARADLQKRLNDAQSSKDAKAVDKLIDDAVANQRAIWDTETRRLEQLRKILTPAQVARILIVLPAMERKIQNQLRKIVQKGKGGDAPSAGAAPAANVKNPFERKNFNKRPATANEDRVEDPFRDERQDSKRPAKQVCDPFGSLHGCVKK